ncbi:winged helix-turn-helix transcriptional regulator [Allonocardiopsis opalescens]|uniref:HxlR family transcriptional regulator n=1 Tax=Allonocardiopsis opalescens TaxID=1144618 RepID=A0A2T0Q501_9ACTN|nr:helix-turn-helix domain-containing protein [Allonocardiopsis opalescens]PRX98895.1 HxlR family transcriptional regulator [Allonocardiopsis opalescens]
MVQRSYGEACGLAHALEVVGERWALLIVRDLLVGPRRYTELRKGLPRIPTNILSSRLKDLELSGVVRRRLLPRPSSAVVYELTEYGADLEEAVVALGRWGARLGTQPRPGDVVTPDSLVMALRSVFRPEAAAGPDVGYELRVDGAVVHARVAGGALTAAPGPLPGADLVIETGPALGALLHGTLTPTDAITGGAVRLTGDPALLDRFTGLFRIPPPAPRPRTGA